MSNTLGPPLRATINEYNAEQGSLLSHALVAADAPMLEDWLPNNQNSSSTHLVHQSLRGMQQQRSLLYEGHYVPCYGHSHCCLIGTSFSGNVTPTADLSGEWWHVSDRH